MAWHSFYVNEESWCIIRPAYINPCNLPAHSRPLPAPLPSISSLSDMSNICDGLVTRLEYAIQCVNALERSLGSNSPQALAWREALAEGVYRDLMEAAESVHKTFTPAPSANSPSLYGGITGSVGIKEMALENTAATLPRSKHTLPNDTFASEMPHDEDAAF